MRVPSAMTDLQAYDLKQVPNRGMTIAARIGYATHGVVYGMVGALALLAAVGHASGRITDSHGAVHRLGRGDWGEPLLWAIAIGTACYALWNVVRAIFDSERHGSDAKGLLVRGAYLFSALTHSFLAIYAYDLANGISASDNARHRSIGQAFDLPGGRLAIGLIGAGVIGFGLFELYRAIRNKVGHEFVFGRLPAAQSRLAIRIARIGVGARGVVFPIIGTSLIAAAIDANPNKAQSAGGVLREIARQPYGSVLLGIVAAGLIAYGVYQLCVAHFARIPPAA